MFQALNGFPRRQGQCRIRHLRCWELWSKSMKLKSWVKLWCTLTMNSIYIWIYIYIHMVVSWVIGVPPFIIHFTGISLYKPSSYGGTPMTMETSIYWNEMLHRSKKNGQPMVDWWQMAGRSAGLATVQCVHHVKPLENIWWVGELVYSLVGCLVAITFIFPEILGMSSSQLTNSYISEGWVYNHQPVVLRNVTSRFHFFHVWLCLR